MENNQQQYFRFANYEPDTPDNYSLGQNWDSQQRFNGMNIYQDGNNNQRCLSSTPGTMQYPQQCKYGHGCRPTGTISNNYGINDGYYGQVSPYSIDCCGSKGDNTLNQYGRYERNDELNSYNYIDKTNSSPSSLTNCALNIHMNGLYNNPQNSNSHFRQQSNLFPPQSYHPNQTTSGTGDITSNSFDDYQRKSC